MKRIIAFWVCAMALWAQQQPQKMLIIINGDTVLYLDSQKQTFKLHWKEDYDSLFTDSLWSKGFWKFQWDNFKEPWTIGDSSYKAWVWRFQMYYDSVEKSLEKHLDSIKTFYFNITPEGIHWKIEEKPLKENGEAKEKEERNIELELGEKEILIKTDDKEGKVIVIREEEEEEEEEEDFDRWDVGLFNMDFGWNAWWTEQNFAMPSAYDTMGFLRAKSVHVRLTFVPVQWNLTRWLQWYSGIALDLNNFHFAKSYWEQQQDSILVLPLPAEVKKNKLATTTIMLPLELRLRLAKEFRIGLGGYVGYVLNSRRKWKFVNDKKSKVPGDFGLNLLRYGATFRIIWGQLTLYTHLDLQPFFRFPTSPLMQTISMGIGFTMDED